MLALDAPSFALRCVMMNPGLILYHDMTKALICCDNVSLVGLDACVIELMFFCQFPRHPAWTNLEEPKAIEHYKICCPLGNSFHAISVTVLFFPQEPWLWFLLVYHRWLMFSLSFASLWHDSPEM